MRALPACLGPYAARAGVLAGSLVGPLVGSLASPLASPLAAQVVATRQVARAPVPPQYLPLDRVRDRTGRLRAPVTLRADALPLETALDEIAEQAGLGISYGEEVVRSGTRVTFAAASLPAAEALLLAVRGTPWEVLATSSGQVTVARRRTRVIGGTVVDSASGRPVPNAQVEVVGTRLRAVTNGSGRWAITGVPERAREVRATGMGYRPQLQPVDSAAGAAGAADEAWERMDFRLAAQARRLDAVVAIGYGTARRQDVTGAIASVRGRDLGNRGAAPTTAVSSTLAGRAPGVQAVVYSGVPGASASVQIRGAQSISASSNPLYVVDGIPVSQSAGSTANLAAGTPLHSIDPNNIESVEILKDASATAIYGARGANGVVLVTTRRGSPGRGEVNLATSMGWQRPTKFIPVLDAPDFMRLANEGAANAGLRPRYSPQRIAAAQTFDYPRLMLQGLRWQPQESHVLTLSGGDERTRYLLSGDLLEQRGVVVNSSFARAGARVNLDREMSARFRVGTSLSGTHADQKVNTTESRGILSSEASGMTAAMMFDPSLPPRDSLGQWNKVAVLSEVFNNPLAEASETRNPSRSSVVLGSAFGELDLAPGLRLRATLGGTVAYNATPYFAPGTIATGQNVGVARQTSSERRELTNEYTLDWARPLGPGTLEALAGASVQTSRFESFQAQAQGFPGDRLGHDALGLGATPLAPTVDATEWRLLSQLGRVSYNLRDRYLFTATARRDGSSRFGTNDKWAFFPSAAFAWRVVDEPWVRRRLGGGDGGRALLSDLKLRMSVGRTGNQAVTEYQSLSRLAPAYVGTGDNTDVVALAPAAAAPNPDLKWETQDQSDVGLDVGLLGDRVIVSLDAYLSRTRNLLLSRPLPYRSGYASQLQNVGALENRGVEMSLTTENVVTATARWRTTLNLAANRNRVTQLYGGLRHLGSGSGTRLGMPLNTIVGHRVLGLWQRGDACPLINAAECTPGEYRLLDANGDGVITDDDRVPLGTPEARFHGGVNSNLEVGPFILDAYLNFSSGNEVNNASMRFLGLVAGFSNERRDRALDRWTPTHTETLVPRANLARNNDRVYSTYVEDGSFVRLQTLTLGWRVPRRLVPRASSARLVVTGQNLWIATRYSGYDPEQAAVDPGGYPRARAWNLGLDVTF